MTDTREARGGGRETNGTATTVVAFLAGAAVGAGLALLLAPKTGSETRRALRESLEGAEGVLKANLDRGLALLDEAKMRLGEAIEAGREAARRETARLTREWRQGGGEPGAEAEGAPRAAEGAGSGPA